jgi:hypothetical protein
MSRARVRTERDAGQDEALGDGQARPGFGPDVIHIQTNGVYHGVVDEVVETRGRLTI